MSVMLCREKLPQWRPLVNPYGFASVEARERASDIYIAWKGGESVEMIAARYDYCASEIRRVIRKYGLQLLKEVPPQQRQHKITHITYV